MEKPPLYASLVGLTTHLISAGTTVLFNVRLGFCPLTFKNVVKTTVLTGVTTITIHFIKIKGEINTDILK